jgi:hypothetical protein
MHDSSGRDLTFVSVLPQLSPATGLGANSVATYAARQGVDAAAFTEGMADTHPEQVGKTIVNLVTDPGHEHPAHLYVNHLAGRPVVPCTAAWKLVAFLGRR